jgi:hypothetical protein
MSFSTRREASTTAAPAASSTSAKRRPSPDDVPVIRATRPSRRNVEIGSITTKA